MDFNKAFDDVDAAMINVSIDFETIFWSVSVIEVFLNAIRIQTAGLILNPYNQLKTNIIKVIIPGKNYKKCFFVIIYPLFNLYFKLFNLPFNRYKHDESSNWESSYSNSYSQLMQTNISKKGNGLGGLKYHSILEIPLNTPGWIPYPLPGRKTCRRLAAYLGINY